MGSRAEGTNPRALGTNPRAVAARTKRAPQVTTSAELRAWAAEHLPSLNEAMVVRALIICRYRHGRDVPTAKVRQQVEIYEAMA